MPSKKLSLAVISIFGCVGANAVYAAMDLYVDSKTQQIYASPGKGRVKLGTFEKVEESAEAPPEKSSSKKGKVTLKGVDEKGSEIQALESRLDKQKESMREMEQKLEKVAAQQPAPGEKKWYDKISIGGYSQLRYSQLLSSEDKESRQNLMTPTDRSIGQNQDFLFRRVRLKVSGDISDYLSLYMQGEFGAGVSGITGTDNGQQGNFFQIRDAYADVYFDKAHEFRIRPGISKVPFGWETLQSSQNRVAFERSDAIDSTAVRDERDLGIFAYWSPEVAQQRFKYLQKSGMRGSGDYGVVGLGIYNGQGVNRFEINDSFHFVGRVTWPFQLPMDQYLEVGASGYAGRYVNTPQSFSGKVNGADKTFFPIVDGPGVCEQDKPGTCNSGDTRSLGGKGVQDARGAIHAILYPRPFGLQTEWTWGVGPELSKDFSRIEASSLFGGYIEALYKIDHFYGSWMPYVKWETYNGGSKFDRNAPHMEVEQVEAGVEYSPIPELELTASYAYMDRTNVGRGPYKQAKGDVLRLQLQYNY